MPDPSKIHPALAERMRAAALAVAAPMIPVIVGYRERSLRVTESLHGIGQMRRSYRLIPAVASVAIPDAIERLSERDQVQMIWYDAPVHTMLDVSTPLIGAPAVWAHSVSGRGIKVGVVDTGIDPDHPDFAQRISQMKDFTGEGPADRNGHGTHVAGIIAGSGVASGSRYRGVAPECLLYVAKALHEDGSGVTSDVMAAIEWGVQQGVQVINISLGGEGPCDGTDALSVLCDAAVARGVVICAAAGNSGPSPCTIGSPGCAKTVITVGATDKEDQVASFSSRGPTLDNRAKPDVCFPGVNIVSCLARGSAMGTPVDDWYTRASGTSMATPHATGTCALLLQAAPGLGPQQIKELMMNTAKDLGRDQNAQGKGRVDVLAAFTSALGQTPEAQPPLSPPAQPSGCLATVKGLIVGR